MASSDSRMDSSAGSRVSAAIRMTPMAIANGTAEVGVEGERGEQQGEHRRDHRGRGERDGLADPGHRPTIASLAGCPGVEEVAEQAAAQAAGARVVLARGGVLPGPQLLADPEHQEQPVVRARAQHQHDQQELRRWGTPGARAAAASATSGPAMVNDSSGGMHRHQGEGERPEDQHQQHDDEQQRQGLDLVAGVTGGLLLVHLRGDVARQVRLQPGRQVRLGDLGAQAVRPGRWRSSRCRRPAARARRAAPRARRRTRRRPAPWRPR